MASEFERVVVTGMGVASPLGCTLADFWGGLLEGHSGIVEIEDMAFSELPVRIGGLVLGNMVEESFSRKEARRMSRSSQLMLVAASQAISEAGLTQGDLDPSEVGVLIGSSIGGFSASKSHFRDYYLGDRFSPIVIPVSMNSSPASHISIRYGFQGPLMAIDAACGSGAHSIG